MGNLGGTLLVILAAICFGFMGLFASWAMAAGVSVEMLLFLRFAIAGVVMAALALQRNSRVPPHRVLLGLIGMGAVLYVAESLFFFHALKHIPVGLVSLLLYMYPVVVTLIAWLFLGEALNRMRIAALSLAVVGLALTIGPVAVQERSSMLPNAVPRLGVLLGVGCCLSYSLYILVGGPLTRRAGAIPASTIVIVSAAVCFGVFVMIRGDAWPQSALAWAGIASLAIVGTVIPISAVLFGLDRIGPVQTSTLSTLEPVVTAMVGATLMGQRMSAVQIVGGACIVLAALLVANSAGRRPRHPPHTNVEVYEIH